MIFRWLFSRTVRQATDLCRRVQRLVQAQRDLLAPTALSAIAEASGGVRTALANGANHEAILAQLTHLEATANKWLKPYPFAAMRENIDVLLVALVVALGFRTFFLQPMAIPTGSMQPTLYGITPPDMRKQPVLEIPNVFVQCFDKVFRGISYYHVIAEVDGEFQGFEKPETVFPFVKRQRFKVGGHTYRVWFPPDKFEERSGLRPGDQFHKGDDIIKSRVVSGDRLFVDRVTYNFRRPRRGEIVIFLTHGIEGLQQDTHYIKRLIGLGGETVQIGNDRHVIIDGKRLDASDPGFENLYSIQGPPEENRYSGHVNKAVAQSVGRLDIAERFRSEFRDETTAFRVRPGHYFVMGDNTMNSYDSRYWSDFPREKVVGKCAFVFWPISSRFGWGFR